MDLTLSHHRTLSVRRVGDTYLLALMVKFSDLCDGPSGEHMRKFSHYLDATLSLDEARQVSEALRG